MKLLCSIKKKEEKEMKMQKQEDRSIQYTSQVSHEDIEHQGEVNLFWSTKKSSRCGDFQK